MVPKRAAELIDGGSLFWVIRGQIPCRERILDIRPFVDKEGVGRCRLVLDGNACRSASSTLAPFRAGAISKQRKHRAICHVPRQAPHDARTMRRELRELGLL